MESEIAMWQKAKVLNIPGYDNVGTTGKEFWVRGKPQPPAPDEWLMGIGSEGRRMEPQTVEWFLTNLVDVDGVQLHVDHPTIELLNEHAEEVELVTWEDFCRD